MNLFRAVSLTELQDLRTNNNCFRDSPHHSGEKGLFFEEAAAVAFADRMNEITNELHIVLRTSIDDSAITLGRSHQAAGEGDGVYLLASDWALLSPPTEVSR